MKREARRTHAQCSVHVFKSDELPVTKSQMWTRLLEGEYKTEARSLNKSPRFIDSASVRVVAGPEPKLQGPNVNGNVPHAIRLSVFPAQHNNLRGDTNVTYLSESELLRLPTSFQAPIEPGIHQT